MTQKKHAILVPLAAMVLFWALTPISIAWIKDDFSLFFQVWVRYVCSTGALWVFLLMSGNGLAKDISTVLGAKSFFLSRLSVTALCTILFQLLYTWCFFLIPPGFGILLYQSQVLFSVLLGVLFIRAERHLIKQSGTVLGIIMAFVGTCLVIIFQRYGFSMAVNTGVLLALGGALSWSMVGLSVRLWVEDRLSPLFTVTFVFTLVCVYLTPLLLLPQEHITAEPGWDKWLVLIGSGLLGIGGGQTLFYYLLPLLGVITTASVQLLVPFVTVICSFLLFGEQMTLLQIIGGLLLLGGCRVVLVQKQKVSNVQKG